MCVLITHLPKTKFTTRCSLHLCEADITGLLSKKTEPRDMMINIGTENNSPEIAGVKLNFGSRL